MGLKHCRLRDSEQQRHWWFAGAIESIGHMAALHDPAKAECVWKWYADNPEGRKAQLKTSYEKYPSYTPTSVLLALLQRECGKLMPETAQK